MKDRSTEKGTYLSCTEDRLQPEEKPLVRETTWTLYLNGQELVTILCTPEKMKALTLGFLASG